MKIAMANVLRVFIVNILRQSHIQPILRRVCSLVKSPRKCARSAWFAREDPTARQCLDHERVYRRTVGSAGRAEAAIEGETVRRDQEGAPGRGHALVGQVDEGARSMAHLENG